MGFRGAVRDSRVHGAPASVINTVPSPPGGTSFEGMRKDDQDMREICSESWPHHLYLGLGTNGFTMRKSLAPQKL